MTTPDPHTIYLTTDAQQDTTDAGERNTEAAVCAFSEAWERAAVLIGNAGGFCVQADAQATVPEMHAATQANYRELAHLDRWAVAEWVAAFWQAAHDCTTSSRPGRWTVDRADCKQAGERLRASFGRLPRA